MVDVLGHLGMGLLWLAPAWYFIDDRRTAAVFVGVGFWFGMLPDVDLVLSSFQGIHHHGVFHTVLAAVVFAAILGPILGWLLKRLFGGTTWFSREAADHATALGVIAVGLPSLAHVFADMLSAPDTSTRIEPLWPLVDGPVVYMDVLFYQSFWATIGLFVLGLAANVAFYYWSDQNEESRRTQPS
ncbi:metal-dependent hydrolase [Halococcus sp. PRR34]|uniref:metal-dependent hydrolase n=1 Tax=Halococcus sp. PRR34 TaxID=3020830 RepID=UPI00235E0077|nr:metal-dependent hydrolase [Halococcus sp. PRR34]